MSSSFAGWRTSCLWRFMERTERTVRSRRRLTCLAIRYTGTGYLGSALAMNKGMAKQLFLENGIPTPRGTSLKRGEDAAKIETCGIHFPCVVKPCSGGSSIGVSIVHDKAEYEQALKEAFRWENELVIEEYVKGRDFLSASSIFRRFRSSRSRRWKASMIIRTNTKQEVR